MMQRGSLYTVHLHCTIVHRARDEVAVLGALFNTPKSTYKKFQTKYGLKFFKKFENYKLTQSSVSKIKSPPPPKVRRFIYISSNKSLSGFPSPNGALLETN